MVAILHTMVAILHEDRRRAITNISDSPLMFIFMFKILIKAMKPGETLEREKQREREG